MYVFQTNLSRTNWWPCYLMKSPSCDYYWTSQMISQHWYWRQQAFTWADHDQVLCRHMQSLGPNRLSVSLLTTSPDSYVVPIVRIGLGENWSVISASKWAHVIFFSACVPLPPPRYPTYIVAPGELSRKPWFVPHIPFHIHMSCPFSENIWIAILKRDSHTYVISWHHTVIVR